MTPFAVTQRAARLAVELCRIEQEADGPGGPASDEPWSVEHVLRCLYRAGLTLEADLGEGGTRGAPSTVAAALTRLDPDWQRKP